MNKQHTYHPEVSKALEIAQKIGQEYLHSHFSGGHLLKALLNADLSLLKHLESLGIDVFYLEEWAEVRMEESLKNTKLESCEPSEVIDSIFVEAEAIRELLSEEEITLWAVFVALSTHGVAFNFDQMKTYPVTRNELLNNAQKTTTTEDIPFSSSMKNHLKGFLNKYCVNKKEQIKNKKDKDFAVGRISEIQQIIEVLCRFNKQNILIVGDSGVGKTSLIDSFIQKVVSCQVPDLLHSLAVFELDMGTLIAGASYKGEIEDRIKNISQELKQYPKSVLIIEEIHALLGNSSDTTMMNLLKSELTKGLTIIATTSIEEYTKKIEKTGLDHLFERIELQETDDETHFRMLKQSLKTYEQHHHIYVDDTIIWEAIRLAKRYLKEKSLPASAIDLIDHAMAMHKTAGSSFLKEKNTLLTKIIHLEDNTQGYTQQEQKKQALWLFNDIIQKATFITDLENWTKKINALASEPVENILNQCRELLLQAENIAQNKHTHITEFDLALLISQKTNIPVGKLKEEEKQRLGNMESILSQRVVGQDHAISSISEAVLENRSGLSKAGQPIGSFFFLGPTGTGKTELAKSLAEFLFQDENAIIRFDMSEFKEEHSAALLYGAPPGYVGYEEGGLLVNKIRQKPYSIVLFDEIEKAHSSVFDVFLQIMDEGKLHDRLGKEGDFSNAIILFTSNIGSDFIVKSFADNKIPTSSELMEIMSRYFRPEFLGRLTEIVPFAPISKENALQIFEIHLNKEFLDLTKKMNFSLQIHQEVKELLTEQGYDATYGARPLKGVIRSKLRRPLAKKIVAGEFKEGDSIDIIVENNEIVWKKI
ncbi:AAA family ATPase [Capnocytophaga canis]|uniref:AAA family ATPase n=1 Tax=Capnocytophaga canis TaxID=1848903 RepID=UPI00370D2AD2